MIDFHVLHTIANGVKYYTDTEAAFNKVFYDVADAYKTKLYAKLQNTKVSYNSGYLKKAENFPLITVTTDESTDDTDNQVLNNRGFASESVLFLNQECTINIYAPDIDTLRVLHRIVQTSMLLFKKDFFKIGYLNIEFIKSSDLAPEKDLVGEDVIVYRRQITYNAQRQLGVKPIDDTIDSLSWDIVPTIIDNSNL